MIRPIQVDKQSHLLGEECALCKHPLSPGEEIVICPQDATRHHVHCWQANDNRCSAYGCEGRGPIISAEAEATTGIAPTISNRVAASMAGSGPARLLVLAQSCLVLSIALAVVLIAIACFGLWAMADYFLIDVLGWEYRAPFNEGAGVWMPGLVLALVTRCPFRKRHFEGP